MKTCSTLLIAICTVLMVNSNALCQPGTLWSKRLDIIVYGSLLYHDGDYIVNGYITRNDTSFSIIAKLDSVGEIIWESVWDDVFFHKHIIATPNSGVAVIGQTRDSFMIKKFDMNGDLLYSWQFEWRNPKFTGFLSDAEGGYILSGYSWTSDDYRYDFILLRVSAEGELEWQRIYRDRPLDQYCRDITPLPDGGFMLVGHTRVNNYENEINVIRTDEEGDVIWQNHYGTDLIDIPANDAGYAIASSDDDNFIIAGATATDSPRRGLNQSVLMLKIDIDGELIWIKVIDMGKDERAVSMSKTMDGGYIIAGHSYNPNFDRGVPFIMKVDHCGNLVWSDLREELGLSYNDLDYYGILAHEDRTFSLISNRRWLYKYETDPHGVAEGGRVLFPLATGLVAAYPNPFNSMATIGFVLSASQEVSLQLFDQHGRIVETLVDERLSAGSFNTTWNAATQPTGTYFYRLQAGSFQQTKMLTLIK